MNPDIPPTGGFERGRDDPDHPSPAQSPSPVPAQEAEEGGGVAAAGQGGARDPVRHVGPSEVPLLPHAGTRPRPHRWKRKRFGLFTKSFYENIFIVYGCEFKRLKCKKVVGRAPTFFLQKTTSAFTFKLKV